VSGTFFADSHGKCNTDIEQTSAGIKYGATIPGIDKGLLMHFEQRGVILTLREVRLLIRKPYKHCWAANESRPGDH